VSAAKPYLARGNEMNVCRLSGFGIDVVAVVFSEGNTSSLLEPVRATAFFESRNRNLPFCILHVYSLTSFSRILVDWQNIDYNRAFPDNDYCLIICSNNAITGDLSV